MNITGSQPLIIASDTRVRVIAPSGSFAFNGTYIASHDIPGFHKVLEDGKTEEEFGIHIIYEKAEDGTDRIIPIN